MFILEVISLRVLVCVQQVPDWREEISFAAPEGVPQRLDPCSGYALEVAARIRDIRPQTHITVLALEGELALRESLAVAADQAFLIAVPPSDPREPLFKGVILAHAVQAIEDREGTFDLVLCGQQSSDGASGQTGPFLAQTLGRALVSKVLSVSPEEDGLLLDRETDGGVQTVEADTPCVALCTKPGWELRHPTILRKMASRDADIPEFSTDGLAGSVPAGSIRVLQRLPARRKAGTVWIREVSGGQAARKLLALLEERQIQ